jgi:hypothetical protein
MGHAGRAVDGISHGAPLFGAPASAAHVLITQDEAGFCEVAKL